MAKHPLLQKKAGSGWNLCDPNGGVSGEGKTRDGLNKVLEQSKAGTGAMRLAAWKVTIRDGKGNTRTVHTTAETYKGAEKSVSRQLKPGEMIQGATVASKLATRIDPKEVENWIKRLMKNKGMTRAQAEDEVGKVLLEEREERRQQDVGLVLQYIKMNGPSTTQRIALGLGMTHEQAYGILKGLQETGILSINKMRWNLKVMAAKKVDPKKALDTHPELPANDLDNPLCICGRRFYDHEEDARVYQDASQNVILCDGFMPVEGGDTSVHIGAADNFYAYECQGCQFAGDFEAAEKHEKESGHKTKRRVYDGTRYKQSGGIVYRRPVKQPLTEMERPHHGAVCGECGRTVTEAEYSSGESKCCNYDVCSEEEYDSYPRKDASAKTALKLDPKWVHEETERLKHKIKEKMLSKGQRQVEKQYPDSAAGAIECLAYLSAFDTKGATARPDPSVEGVWMVTMKSGEQAIVYLKGYKDPLHKIRETNDFEEVEPKKTGSAKTARRPSPKEYQAAAREVYGYIPEGTTIGNHESYVEDYATAINETPGGPYYDPDFLNDYVIRIMEQHAKKAFGSKPDEALDRMDGNTYIDVALIEPGNKDRGYSGIYEKQHDGQYWLIQDVTDLGPINKRRAWRKYSDPTKHIHYTSAKPLQKIFEDPTKSKKTSKEISGVQPCCGAFAPNHKPDCKAYQDNFDKTITTLRSLPKRSASLESLALQHKDHDEMCNLNDPICKAFIDMRIMDPGWHPITRAPRFDKDSAGETYPYRPVGTNGRVKSDHGVIVIDFGMGHCVIHPEHLETIKELKVGDVGFFTDEQKIK